MKQYKIYNFFQNIYSEAADSADDCNHAASLLKIFASLLGMFKSNKDNDFSLNEIERMIADQQCPIPEWEYKKMVRFNSAPVELPERPSNDMVAQEGPVDCYQYNSEY